MLADAEPGKKEALLLKTPDKRHNEGLCSRKKSVDGGGKRGENTGWKCLTAPQEHATMAVTLTADRMLTAVLLLGIKPSVNVFEKRRN